MNPAIVVLLVCLVASIVFFIFSLLKNLRPAKPQLQASEKTVLLLSLLWSGVYVVFLFFWLPQNTFYRLFYLPALILLLGLALTPLKNSRALAAFVTAAALANFLFQIYPFSHTEKYPPLTFALQLNREWPAGTVIYYGMENSDAQLIRYFNPATRWQLLHSALPEVGNGGTVWLETTAIDQLAKNDPLWLERHMRKETMKEVSDSSYRIKFVQVY
jgi:hypothetical protein